MKICNNNVVNFRGGFVFLFCLFYSISLLSQEKVEKDIDTKSPKGETTKVEKKNVVKSDSKDGMPKEVKPTLIVFNITPEKGVEAGAANLLTEYILTEISGMKKYNVVGQNDIDKMLMWETNKQLKNCTDSSCVAQIAGAMGAEYYVIGSIGVMGDRYMVNLKLINVMKAEVENRLSELVKRDENALVVSTRDIVKKLFGIETEGGEEKVVEKVEGKGRGSGDMVGYGLIGLGLVGIGVGGYYTKAGMDARDRYEGSAVGAEGYIREIEDSNRNAMISYISGGVLVGGGILYILFFGKESEGVKEGKSGRNIRWDIGSGYIGVRVRY